MTTHILGKYTSMKIIGAIFVLLLIPLIHWIHTNYVFPKIQERKKLSDINLFIAGPQHLVFLFQYAWYCFEDGEPLGWFYLELTAILLFLISLFLIF